jgi:hypothetical protein
MKAVKEIVRDFQLLIQVTLNESGPRMSSRQKGISGS